MKKYIVILFFVFIITPSFAKASVLYSQSITLSPGWNIVSTPKVLESHTFSAAETSNNFDIYALDSSKTSGWATLADLGQVEFTLLFGYFINNKTGTSKTLTFNYKDVSIPEQLFSRTFPTSGWYSFGIANSTYAKDVNSNNTDINNPDNILQSLIGTSVHYGDVVDFTDANYGGNGTNSVAVVNPFKSATRSADISNNTEINTLNDFRETKGYAVYIKDANTNYSGLQNTTIPQCSDGIDNDGDGFIDMSDNGCSNSADNNEILTLAVSSGELNPVSGNVQASDTNLTPDVLMLEFKLNVEGSDITFNSLDVNLDATIASASLSDMLNNLILKNGSNALATISDFSGGEGVYTFNLDDVYTIHADDTDTFRIYATINGVDNFSDGDSLKIDFNNIDTENILGDPIIETGSASGEIQTFLSSLPPILSNMSWAVASSGTIIDFFFTIENNDDDFDVLENSILYTTVGTSTISDPNLSLINGSATLIDGGFTVNEGDLASFRIRYVLTGENGTWRKITITSVGGQLIPDDNQVSPTATLNID